MDNSMKILIVDDSSTTRKIEKKILNELGFENICEADDGSTALPLLENGDIDFVITDWYMQNMQGFDLLVAIRKNPKLCKIPVMMVTAKVEQEELVAAAKETFIWKTTLDAGRLPVFLRNDLLEKYQLEALDGIEYAWANGIPLTEELKERFYNG